MISIKHPNPESSGYVQKIKRELSRELISNSTHYLRIGLERLHAKKEHSYRSIQPAVGNFGISIELMLKAYIAAKNPLLLFLNLPLPLICLFSCPDSIENNFNWQLFDINLRTFFYKSIELKDCIETFYVFFPKERQSLQPYFRFLSQTRNLSVHAALPSFQKYELERIGFLALRISTLLNESKIFKYYSHSLDDQDKKFISLFNDHRSKRVSGKIEKAKIKSKSIKQPTPSISVDDWNAYVTDCPICKSDGILDGYTEVSSDIDEDGNVGLDFLANSFHCEECGLKLDDVNELELVNMDILYDRTNEIDDWDRENSPDHDYL